MVGSNHTNPACAWFLAAIFVGVAAGCGRGAEELQPAAGPVTPRTVPQTITDPTPGVWLYIAGLVPLNQGMSERTATGRATFVLDEQEGTLTTDVHVEGLSPGSVHAVYVHGSPVGDETFCPTIDADSNGDEVIDVVELGVVSGPRLISLKEQGLSLQAGDLAFSGANPEGVVRYETSVLVDDLFAPVRAEHGMASVKLDRGVVVFYGVGENATVPASVERLDELSRPASIPVACGEIVRVS